MGYYTGMAQQLNVQAILSLDPSKFNSGVEQAQVKLGDFKSGVNNTKNNLNQFNTTTNETAGSFALLQGAVAGYIGLQGAIRAVKIADEFNLLSARIKLVTGDLTEQGRVMADLYRLSAESGTDVGANAKLFTRLANFKDELGLSNQKLLTFTDNMTKLGVVSGASTTEFTNAMIQLSQGLASGTLRGDELRSVMEQMPAITRLIAKEMGVTGGEIRKLAEDGKITSQIVIDAVLGATGEINNKFQEIPRTAGQAWTHFLDGVGYRIGVINNALGATSKIASIFDTLGDSIGLGKKISAVQEYENQLKKIADLEKNNEFGYSSTDIRDAKRKAEELRIAADAEKLAKKYGENADKVGFNFPKLSNDDKKAIDVFNNKLDPTKAKIKEITEEYNKLIKLVNTPAERKVLTQSRDAQIADELAKQAKKNAPKNIDEYKFQDTSDNKFNRAIIDAGKQTTQIYIKQLDGLEAISARRQELIYKLTDNLPQSRFADAQNANRIVDVANDRYLAELKKYYNDIEEKIILSDNADELNLTRAVREYAKAKSQGNEAIINELDYKIASQTPSLSNDINNINKWRENIGRAVIDSGNDWQDYAQRVKEITDGEIAKAYLDDLNRQKDWASGLQQGLNDLNDTWNNQAAQMRSNITSWASGTTDAFVNIINGSKGVGAAFRTMANNILNDLLRMQIQQSITKPLFNNLGSLFSLAGSAASAYFGGGGGFADNYSANASAITASSANQGVQWTGGRFADGGIITKGTTGRADDVLAMVSRGEYIVNAKATRENFALIDAINNGRLPKFADGGAVDITMNRGGEFNAPKNNVPLNQSFNITINAQGAESGVEQKIRAELAGLVPLIVKNARDSAVAMVQNNARKSPNFRAGLG